MNRAIQLFVLILLLSNYACKTSQLVKPMEEYDERTEAKISNIHIPVKVSLKELEKSINEQMQGLIYEDNDMNDGDNMMVRAEKREDIKLSVDSQMIKYTVPLGLWIKYDIGFSNVEAVGDIALDFSTSFNITEDWEIETSTKLNDYEWLKRPKLKMAGISLPVGSIANLILSQSRTQITESIDTMVAENFKLRELVEDAWSKLFEPFLVSEDYNTWLIVNPQRIAMTEMLLSQDTISSTIVVQSAPEVKLGVLAPEKRPVQSLPLFQYSDLEAEDFEIHLRTAVTYEEAERLAKVQLVGETFEQGSRSVTIEDIELYGNGDNLVVNTKLSGSYDGEIYLTGRPVYNRRKNAIDIKDLKFTLETRNFLVKSAGWLLKSTIKKKIQENMDFLLDYNMTEMKAQFQEQLQDYKVTEGVVINGFLEEMNIENAYLAPEAMQVELVLRGNINVLVKGLK